MDFQINPGNIPEAANNSNSAATNNPQKSRLVIVVVVAAAAAAVAATTHTSRDMREKKINFEILIDVWHQLEIM